MICGSPPDWTMVSPFRNSHTSLETEDMSSYSASTIFSLTLLMSEYKSIDGLKAIVQDEWAKIRHHRDCRNSLRGICFETTRIKLPLII